MKKEYVSIRLLSAAAACLILVVALTGCTTTNPKYSGWLETDYEKLQPDPEFDGAMFWLTADDTIAKYDRVMIDNVAVHIDPEIEEAGDHVDAATVQEITRYFKQTLIKEFQKSYEIVDEPGDNVVRIRSALTAVELTKKDLKAYQFVPVALVFTAVTEAAGARNRLAVINMEAVATDSLTGEILAMVVQQQAHETSIQAADKLTAKDVQSTLDFWAKKAKMKWDRGHGKGM